MNRQFARSSHSVTSARGRAARFVQSRPQLTIQRLLRPGGAGIGALTADEILDLQRTIGNRATGHLLATPSSEQASEQEAGHTALHVMRSLSIDSSRLQNHGEQEVPAPAIHRPPHRQTQTKAAPAPGSASAKARQTWGRPTIQRTVRRDEHDGAVHGPAGGDVAPEIAQAITQARGSGKPLDDGVRASMEQGFDADFASVRVHTDDLSATLNRSLNARAFTAGSDIFFGKGEFNPGSSAGQELLAHELTHTVQQGAAVQRQEAPPARGMGRRLTFDRPGEGGRALPEHHPGAGNEPYIQRAVYRGYNTGWGPIRWVEGGEALWKRIAQGFNTDLFTLKASLELKVKAYPALRSVLDEIQSFIELWDNKAIYFKATGEQTIDASEFANRIEALVQKVTKAIDDATAPEQEPPKLSEPTPEKQPKQTKQPKQKEQTKVLEQPTQKEQPAQKTEPPELSAAEKNRQKQLEANKLKKEAQAKAKAAAEKQAQQKAAEKQKQKEQQAAARQAAAQKNAEKNAEKQAQREARIKEVTDFGKRISTETNRLINAEKIHGWLDWPHDLNQLIAKASNRVQSNTDVEKALQDLYDAWTKILDTKREENRIEKQGSKSDWQRWTGLDTYKVVENLAGAQYTPAKPPILGPLTETGDTPADLAPTQPIPIHVTYDGNSVAPPPGPVNGVDTATLVDRALQQPPDWQRIHATLEANPQDNPHVYWGPVGAGLIDLAQARYYQWLTVDPDWTPGPEGAPAEPKVRQVLNNYVANTVIPEAQKHAHEWTYTVYTWPAFADMRQPKETD